MKQKFYNNKNAYNFLKFIIIYIFPSAQTQFNIIFQNFDRKQKFYGCICIHVPDTKNSKLLYFHVYLF